MHVTVCVHMQRMPLCISFVYENRGLEEFPLRVCICECVFPHNKARSLIFNAAETTTSTQSEPGEACFPAQPSLPSQQETKLGDTVWNGSKQGPRHRRTLQPNNTQGILSTGEQSIFSVRSRRPCLTTAMHLYVNTFNR